jgi:hypothetical protein
MRDRTKKTTMMMTTRTTKGQQSSENRTNVDTKDSGIWLLEITDYQVAVIVQISDLDATADRIGCCSSYKVFVPLAIALRNRLQSINRLMRIKDSILRCCP